MPNEGQRLKEEVLAKIRAKSHNWLGFALYQLRRLPAGEYTGEDVRYAITKKIGEPKHHNVWGALIHHAVREGYLTPTSKTAPMSKPSSHARRTPVYKLEGLG